MLEYNGPDYFFELKLYRRRIRRSDCVRNVLANPKCLLLRLTFQINEKRICVTIDNSSTPLVRRVDDINGLTPKSVNYSLFSAGEYLFQRLATTLHNTVCNLNGRHATGICRTRVPISHIGNIFQAKLPSIQNTLQHLELGELHVA